MEKPSKLYPYFQDKSSNSSNPMFEDIDQVVSVPDHTGPVVNEKCDDDPHRHSNSQIKPSDSKEDPYLSLGEESIEASNITCFGTKRVPMEQTLMPPDLITSKMPGEPDKLENIAVMSNDGEVNSV